MKRLKVDCHKWNDNAQSLRHQAMMATHSRTRERFLALDEITQGKNATTIAGEINRRPHPVMAWVHIYNQAGAAALIYRQSGGRSPPLSLERRNHLAIALLERLDESVGAPQEREESFQPRWTVKRLVAWLQEQSHGDCCRETCWNALKQLGFSWKKAGQLLNKANPIAREAFVDKLKRLLDSANRGQHLLVYLDEAHLSLDTDEG